MGDSLCSFKEIASLAKLGESRARTLRNRYEKAVPSEGEGRSRKYPKEASSILAMADKLEKLGNKPEKVLIELLKTSGAELDSSDDRISRLMKIVEDLSREVSDLKRRDERFKEEIIRLNRKVRSLSSKVDRLSNKKSLWEEILRSVVKFLDDLFSL
ncbi:hypothetical protein [Dethiosulfovibrio salsuginis]|uniref:MerR HTH family regulatory protein n=1 Tax=Dethiosulfovibrio salsuginis TaxID=561720 RepID=A0A1X7L9G0_9BACT|nr:hypothetical protein [Dethiosulfovibrio salsuginis]SMG49809.1 hypothetical protein SAMN06275492_15012 [Dethiosulfovibrio salsuginis]